MFARLLRQLRDVVVQSPQDGDALVYDGAQEKWKNGSGGSMPSVTRTITAAQLRNELTAGIEITDAPAAGKIIVPLQVLARSNFGSKVYRPATVDIHVSSI